MAVPWEVGGFLLMVAGEGRGFCSTGCVVGRDRVAVMWGSLCHALHCAQ